MRIGHAVSARPNLCSAHELVADLSLWASESDRQGELGLRNAGPVRALEKLGMRREAHLVESGWVKG